VSELSEAILRKIDASYCGRLLEEMVAIPSVVNEERELAEYLKRELEALGLRTRLQEVEKDRPNVIAVHEFPELGPMLMFNGHMDTVPVCEGWTNDPFEPVVKEGRLYGLGAADMKAGIACAITAVRALVESDAPLRRWREQTRS
jgi:acetylornithine deacetylase/succinyl-diaminopimelate desuccinylase-like protein